MPAREQPLGDQRRGPRHQSRPPGALASPSAVPTRHALSRAALRSVEVGSRRTSQEVDGDGDGDGEREQRDELWDAQIERAEG